MDQAALLRALEMYFQYGTTGAYGYRAGLSSTGCPNDGTTTQVVGFTVTNLRAGAGYHYRIVVIGRYGYPLYGRDAQFQTGSTPLPVGAAGGIGLAALGGVALFITQRWRRHRRSV